MDQISPWGLQYMINSAPQNWETHTYSVESQKLMINFTSQKQYLQPDPTAHVSDQGQVAVTFWCILWVSFKQVEIDFEITNVKKNYHCGIHCR